MSTMSSQHAAQLAPRKLIRQQKAPERALPKIPCESPASIQHVDTSNFHGHSGYQYTLLPVHQNSGSGEPSPSSTHSDASDMSPPPSPCYQPEWIFRRLKPPMANTTQTEELTWPAVIRPRSKAERIVPSLSPTVQTRPRGPSVSSIPSVATTSSTSSVSKPPSPQSKSILTRTSSASTKNSLAKSVTFVDAPTVHYRYDDYCEDSYDDCELGISRPPTPPLSQKGKALRGFRRYIWAPKQTQPAPLPQSPSRYNISRPLVLGSVQPDYSDGASLRSTRSNESGRSERSPHFDYGTYPLRTSRSTESFRTAKASNSRFRSFLEKVIP